MARHLRNLLCWAFAFGIALGISTTASHGSQSSHSPDFIDFSLPSSTEPTRYPYPALHPMFAKAEPSAPGSPGKEGEEGANLHPEIQDPSQEAEDVSFLSELEQSKLPQDDTLAYKWFSLAALRGDTEAKRRKAELGKKIGKTNTAKVDREIRGWLRRPSNKLANDPHFAGQAWQRQQS